MATATYANIHVNYPSGQSSVEFNILDADNYGTYDISSSLNNCTFDQAQGRITVGEDGTYLIIASNAVEIDAGTANQVKTRIKVDGVEKYATDFYNVNFTYGSGRERTCHKILSINSGSYVEVTWEENLSNNINVLAGTSVYVQKLYGDFGTFELTGDNADSTAQVNPFNTGSAPGSSSTLSSSFNGGISQAPTGGKLQTANGGPALFLANTYFDGPSGGPALNIEYFKNGSSQWASELRKSSADEPLEGTTIAFENYSANDNVHFEVDFGGLFSGHTMASSSLSLINYPSNDHYAFVHINSTSNDFSTFTFNNLFQSSSYSTNGFSTVNDTSGIIYDSSNGRFNIAKDGDYLVITTVHTFAPSADMQFFFNLYKDGTLITQQRQNQDTSNDPLESTNMIALTVSSGSYLEFKGAGDNTQRYQAGTAIAVIELTDGALPAPPGPPSFSEGTTNNLISNDFTIGTFAQDVLSSQYKRSGTAQVPFSLGVRGPLTLRGRTVSPPSPAIKQGSDDD